MAHFSDFSIQVILPCLFKTKSFNTHRKNIYSEKLSQLTKMKIFSVNNSKLKFRTSSIELSCIRETFPNVI